VEVNGEIDPTGALYTSPDHRMTLVVSGRVGDLIVFEVKERGLLRVTGGEVRFGEGAALVGEDLRLERIGTYAVQGDVPMFQVDSLRVRMIPKTPLTGEVTADSLLRHSPEYGPEMRFYEPYRPAVEALKAQGQPAEVVAVFSAGCGRCRAQVPRLMKVLEEAGGPNLKARFLAVTGAIDSTAAAYRVRYLPTFIVLRGGKEVGRITERPRASIEEDLVAILRGRY
jgi:thiol-disulfide isomerase/thioredoxin